MSILEKLNNKSINIEIEELIQRLILELGIKEDKNSTTLLHNALYHTLLIILDTTHLKKIIEPLYPTWVDMTKDYWWLSGCDKTLNKINQEESNTIKKRKVKSIQVGDTTTTFVDDSNNIEINGNIYKTGTINFDDNILINKYSEALYRNRRFNYGRR